jgi:hypothetical protein
MKVFSQLVYKLFRNPMNARRSGGKKFSIDGQPAEIQETVPVILTLSM